MIYVSSPQSRLGRTSFTKLDFDGFLVALSDVYERARAAQEGIVQSAGVGGVWTPPESFERSTTKYWVHREDVLRVKSCIIKHLPILIFGRDSSTARALTPIETSAITSSSDGNHITSVTEEFGDEILIRCVQHMQIYLDDEELSFYAGRLRREEGAQLYRLRWYGHEAVPPAGSMVFVERKTHHESWVDEASVKERFDIAASVVAPFLDGSLDVARYLDAIAPASAKGKSGQEKAAKQKELAVATQAGIVKHRLTPAMRTRYKRTAFQLASSNTVRISLDTQLQFVDERGRALPRWCRDAHELEADGVVHDFPYAILEVKLQTAPPPWVADLLREGRATRVWKFSKYLSACAIFAPARVLAFPPWFDESGKLLPPEQADAGDRSQQRDDTQLVSAAGTLVNAQSKQMDPTANPLLVSASTTSPAESARPSSSAASSSVSPVVAATQSQPPLLAVSSSNVFPTEGASAVVPSKALTSPLIRAPSQPLLPVSSRKGVEAVSSRDVTRAVVADLPSKTTSMAIESKAAPSGATTKQVCWPYATLHDCRDKHRISYRSTQRLTLHWTSLRCPSTLRSGAARRCCHSSA
jgi:SPX domain protein involved in polyphosphate accumulation